MADRRTLTEGLKATPAPLEPTKEEQFVYGRERKGPQPSPQVSTASLSVRMRSDFVVAIKRASLERQLDRVQPNTIRDILEEAIEPWLRSNGYLE